MTNSLRLFPLYAKLSTLELFRIPAYAIPTVLSPLMVYAFFGLPYSRSPEAGRFLMASYAAFAVIGVALFQFGVGTANERTSSWEGYLRTLAAPVALKFAARIASALAFAVLAAALICAAALTFGHASLDALGWLRLIFALAYGSVPFALIGLAIGYWCNPRAALPVANLVYLPLAFAGGLWLPPDALPAVVKIISPFTPTREYGELVWAAVLGQPWKPAPFIGLAAFAVVFAVVAALGYRRDEGVKYH